MPNEAANHALHAILQALVAELKDVGEQVDLALDDLSGGSRNGAIGALSPVGDALQRMQSFVAAARAVHQSARFS